MTASKVCNERLERLLAEGFDLSRVYELGLKVGCSQCEAMLIQGIACHEGYCPNEKHECKGCDALVGRNVRYCAECML